MSIEMEIPKVLWLKNNMPPELFNRCKFYDLSDALTHLATGNENRSFCSTVCKQGYVPIGVDGSEKGSYWFSSKESVYSFELAACNVCNALEVGFQLVFVGWCRLLRFFGATEYISGYGTSTSAHPAQDTATVYQEAQ